MNDYKLILTDQELNPDAKFTDASCKTTLWILLLLLPASLEDFKCNSLRTYICLTS